jgi:hypothetical protein
MIKVIYYKYLLNHKKIVQHYFMKLYKEIIKRVLVQGILKHYLKQLKENRQKEVI